MTKSEITTLIMRKYDFPDDDRFFEDFDWGAAIVIGCLIIAAVAIAILL